MELEAKVADARARIAFYASTPTYRAAFEHLGLGELAARAAVLSRAQDWAALPGLIDDVVLNQFVVIGTHDEVGPRLLERYGAVVTDIEFSIAIRDEQDRARLADLARELQGADDSAARSTISTRRPASCTSAPRSAEPPDSTSDHPAC
jgi:hypothetical protein